MSTPFEIHSTSEKTPIQKALDWAKKHQEMVFVGGLLVLLIAGGVPYYLNSQKEANQKAQDVLSLAQYYQHAQVDPKNGPFKTEDEKNQQALQTFQKVLNDYAGTPTAKLARFYAAKDQLLLKQFSQAYSNFDVASQELKGTVLGDEAYLGKLISLEYDNKIDQATVFAEAFLKNNPTSSIYPEIALNLSALYLKNDSTKAKATDQLKAIAKNYPDSTWGKEANRRLENLKS
jgi:outer membrane protein assembly factor BamD (BamD/ComL family)